MSGTPPSPPYTYDRLTVAANAERARRSLRLTRSDLSVLTGISERRIGLLFQGRAEWWLRDLHLVARALQIDPLDLLR